MVRILSFIFTAIVLSAAPLLLTGCPEGNGDGGNNGGDGGNGGNNGGNGDGGNTAAIVYINEFSADASQAILDEDGEASDWIELYNGGEGDVALQGWGITDDQDVPFKWVFPDVTLERGAYLLLFASGKDRRLTDGDELHTNFRLSSDGEYLALVDPAGDRIANSVFDPAYPPQFSGPVYGRTAEDGTFFYRDLPTPGAENSGGAVFSEFITFDADRGFHDAPLALGLSTEQSDVQIIYTLDGTPPDAANGTPYEGPLNIAETSVVRAATLRGDTVSSPVYTRTFVITEDPAQRALPMLSLVGDPRESLYEPNGIMAIVGGFYEPTPFGGLWMPETAADYNNPIQHGMDFERPVSIEFAGTAPEMSFQADCGIRVQGSDYHRSNYIRADDWFGCNEFNVNYAKFSFRLAFRQRYGPARLDHALIPLRPEANHDQIILRGGHNDTCDPFIADELSRRLYHDMGQVSSLGTLANLYINGELKGIYNPVERIDENFLQDRHGSSQGWDIILQESEVREGDSVAWDAFLDFVQTTDLSDDQNYATAQAFVDTENFIDYLLVQLYTNNIDWPHNNWIAAKERSPEGRWRFYVWDSELTFLPHRLERVAFDSYPDPDGLGLNGQQTEVPRIYRALAASAAFRAQFAERVDIHFAAGAALSPQNVRARHDELWGVAVNALPGLGTYIRDTYVDAREEILFDALRVEGLYP